MQSLPLRCSHLIASVLSFSLSSGILYLLVYRTENYKRLKSTIDRQSKKCE